MKMKMLLTPISNVKSLLSKRLELDNNNIVIEKIFDWEDTIEVEELGETKPITAKCVSLFEHTLLLDGKKYYIIHAWSKEKF